MRVGIFYNSISNPKKFSNKTMLMDIFKEGVLANGDEVIEYYDNQLPNGSLDAGFILGYTLEDNFRKQIINTLTKFGSHRIFVDSNILHYANNEHNWHRYSIDSVYPTDGIYFFNEIDYTKWDKFSKDHSTILAPYRTTGDHILILAQRPAGWNMKGHDQERWIHKTINKIRKHSNRPIVIRMHPGDNTRFVEIKKLQEHYNNAIIISQHVNIKQDLENCWCVIGYNSTPNVVAAIEGIPVFLADPDYSWAREVANTNLSLIENPEMPDRSEWIHKIANIHWSNYEVQSGKLWKNIKNYISVARS
jgi:hypothetical protein